MTYYIEHDFPIEQLNPLSRREANAKRAIAMLHKRWARRVGCVFRTMILASLIPEEQWRRLDEEARRGKTDAWSTLYYRHPKANPLIEKYLKDKVVLDPFMGGGRRLWRRCGWAAEYLELSTYWKAGIRQRGAPHEVFHVEWVFPRADIETVGKGDVCYSML